MQDNLGMLSGFCKWQKLNLYGMKGKCDMVKQVKISSFNEVKSIVAAATLCIDQIGVHDQQGSIADAKSILGLMSLDYTKPVLLVSENSEELEKVYAALVS